jgi:glycogen debranching enzyme
MPAGAGRSRPAPAARRWMLTILDGTTFCISDDIGDVFGHAAGLYAEDTRYLSEWRLLIDGRPPLLLTSDKVEHFSAAFYLRNPLSAGLPPDTLTISRERAIGRVGVTERILIRNERMDVVSFELSLGLAADFASVLHVKEWELALGDVERASPLPAPISIRRHDSDEFHLDDATSCCRTSIRLSRAPVAGNGPLLGFVVELEPRDEWELVVEIVPTEIGPHGHGHGQVTFAADALHRSDSLTSWRLRVPRLETTWTSLNRTYDQAVQDIAALRIRSLGTAGELPAAGMPWFMTVFGRDTLLTCMQSFILGPELARSALVSLAALQSEVDDPGIDAEPGKIIHELRRGQGARHWFPAYYGTVDATPLFLILLSELWRWTNDDLFVSSLREPALRALAWIDDYGDRDGDGFVEYERRTDRGLLHQSWKDSFDSQCSMDGTQARTPIAPVEVQGYVFDAKLRTAELARAVWRLPELADRLEREAAALQDSFVGAFWVDKPEGYFALALDGDKRQVDALTSNNGHLLWSGIVPSEYVQPVVDRLMGPELWSGWGIRTMSTGCRAYSPLSYHNGTVWPHDSMIGAWGLAKYGYWDESRQVVRAILQAAARFDWSLPEVFAGFDRSTTPFPIAYPTATRPQAWAAASALLGLQLLLGLGPERRQHRLVSTTPTPLPEWVRPLRLTGLRAFEMSWNVSIDDGQVQVERA